MRTLGISMTCGVAVVWSVACGNTTLDRNESHDGGGSSHPDGSAATDGAAAGSNDGDGSGGTGGAALMDAADSAATEAAPLPCNLPTVAPDPNPTPEDQARSELVRAFCANLAQHGCLPSGGVSSQAVGCSTEERVTACEFDALYSYLENEAAACGEVWESAISCAANVDYSASRCQVLPWIGTNYVGKPCDAENEALTSCHNKDLHHEQIFGAHDGNEHAAQVGWT